MHGINPSGIVYDVTNTYFHGTRCPISRYGKSKENRSGKKLIQVGLGVTQEEGIAVMHQLFRGNVHDSKIFEAMYYRFIDFGISNGLFIFDRGISSKVTQNLLKFEKWRILCGLKISQSVREASEKLILSVKLIHPENQVRCGRTTFYVGLVPFSIGDAKGRLAICFNKRKRDKVQDELFAKVKVAQRSMRSGQPVEETVRKYISPKGRILESKLGNDGLFAGHSFIFCTDPSLNAEEIVQKYFDKDIVEKAFHLMKSVIKIRPIRHRLERRVKAHGFISCL